MFYGCSTDSIGGAGPLEHGDWLVQTVSTVLVGGPYISAAHTTGVSDILGQLRTNVGQSVLVTALPPPKQSLNDTAKGPRVLDQSRGVRTNPRGPTRRRKWINRK